MNTRARVYVGLVAGLAVIGSLAFYQFSPPVGAAAFADAVLFAVLALGAESLSILLPRSAMGSMGFIPYIALAFVVPSWPSLVAVAIVRSIVDLHGRRGVVKCLFNVSSHVIMELTAIVLYVALGGHALGTLSDVARLSAATKAVGLQALVAGVVALNVNNMLVAGAIALSTNRSAFRVWVENNRGTVGADVLSTPLIFVFAWVYAAFGAIATATLWIPMLGLRQLQRTNLELEQTNRELLELMVKSLEARDPYTSGHSRRVHLYSTVIGRAIGLTEKELESVGRAALLHDVGKIHEKYAAVLAKTDSLSPDEWALIREHSVDGAELVATMSRLRDIVPSIQHHHENWDGTGYPSGLAGELIPVASRVIRFADTIDAMTTERPYRRPLAEADVKAELIRCRGTQFDPQMTDRLLSSPQWTSLFKRPAVPTDQLSGPNIKIVRPTEEQPSRVQRAVRS